MISAALAIAIFSIAFVLIATEKVNRVVVVLAAAGALATIGLVDAEDIFYSHHSGIDWSVIFLLLGMMVIVGIIKQTGAFEALGVWAAQRSGGHPYRLLVLLMLITAIASPFLDNVTTIMLVAPVTLSVCKRLEIPAAPYLIAEVLASNIGGAATLIGDPPNIIIGMRAGLGFNDFIVHMAPITIILFASFIVLARFMFRKSFVYHPERMHAVMAMDPMSQIRDLKMLTRSLVVLAIVMVLFSLHTVLHMDPAIVALLGAGLMATVTRVPAADYLAEVEWSTLVFFMGLFVMVGALVETSVIAGIGEGVAAAVGDDYFLAATGLVFGSAILGAFFDNIPYAATMAPIVEGLVAQAPDATTGQSLWWSFALGADLGGNGTALAASANVVMLGIASREGTPISFWQFTKYGIVTTIFTTVLAWVWVWLRYFAFV